MDHQRKSKTDKYEQQKKYDKADKFQKAGLTEEEGNLIELIESMSASELDKFMENKFDKMVKTNEKLFPKICRAAQKRMNSFLKEFKDEEKARLIKFVKRHTGINLTEQDTKQIFDPKAFQPFKLTSNELIHVAYVWSRTQAQPKIFMAKVSIFEPKQQFSNVRQKFYIKGVEQKNIGIVDFKRFKKECCEFLQDQIRAEKAIEAALNEQQV